LVQQPLLPMLPILPPVVAAASCFFLLRTALGSNVLCPYKEGVSATTLQLSTTDVFGS